MTTTPPVATYCTILAANYLPKALALVDSVRKHQDGAEVVVLLIDARSDADLPDVPGVRLVGTDFLGRSAREVLHRAAIYDLVEFATSVKPWLLMKLLEESDQVIYLDPDTYVTSPMDELSPALEASEGGILLTPHFLEPLPPDAPVDEGHMLHAGVFNLGFCAVDRRASGFLRWWDDRLRDECLFESAVRLVRRPEVARHRQHSVLGREPAPLRPQRAASSPARAARRT